MKSIDIQLIEAQRTREPVAAAVAQRKADALGDAGLREGAELLAKAKKANRVTKRVRLFHAAVDAMVAPAARVAACRVGCSHCCRLASLPITSAEARILAQRTGREMKQPIYQVGIADLIVGAEQHFSADGADRFTGTACPFLVGDACSVYEDRPTVCRSHLNLDHDALLCQVVPGHPASVPYLNAISIQAQGFLLQREEMLADVRDFFPD